MGSEMCIRDRMWTVATGALATGAVATEAFAWAWNSAHVAVLTHIEVTHIEVAVMHRCSLICRPASTPPHAMLSTSHVWLPAVVPVQIEKFASFSTIFWISLRDN